MQSTAFPKEQDQPSDKQLLEALARSKAYRNYERSFTEATGLPLTFRPVEFFGLPFQGKKNENAFCAFLAGGKSTCSLCLQTQGRCAAASPDGQARSLQCPFGLTETTVPVYVGDRIIGFLATGQVFTRPRNASTFRKSISRIFAAGDSAQKKAEQLWKQTPTIGPTRYQATIQLLTFFAKQLSAMSNQIVLEHETTEPILVIRARHFIAQNKTEALSLGAVAKAAGASVFHFCKVFKGATGLRFTDYLARVRAEDARVRLTNRNVRVSEVAYEVGFQSLTQFNRTFHRIFGVSPSAYRNGVTAQATAA
jgi:AraC-like DNA-binding protein/ligand-binding sensor protein